MDSNAPPPQANGKQSVLISDDPCSRPRKRLRAKSCQETTLEPTQESMGANGKHHTSLRRVGDHIEWEPSVRGRLFLIQ